MKQEADFVEDGPRLQRLCADLIAIGGAICAAALRTSVSCLGQGLLQKAAVQADLVLDISWEKLHTGPWKDVNIAWRNAYSLAALLSIQCQELTLDSIPEAMKCLDLAVMMGGPMYRSEVDAMIGRLQSLASEPSKIVKSRPGEVDSQPESVDRTRIVRSAEGIAAQRIGAEASERDALEEGSGGCSVAVAEECGYERERVETGTEHDVSSDRSKPRKQVGQKRELEHPIVALEASAHDQGERTDHDRQRKRAKTASPKIPLPPGSQIDSNSVARRHMPSLESFLCEHMLQEQPVILTGVVSQWPAFEKWQDLQYFKRVAGLRTVPVEVGETYVAEKWRQELMTVEKFVETYMEGEPGGSGPEERGYLAQHPLFEQIPELRKDIAIPDYCSVGGGEMQSVNAWFGPPGTVTPLHYDPHHNLLAQVVGRKYIRLCPPLASPSVYPHKEGMLTNTSRVDLDRPDPERFPLFAAAPFVDCVLEAGEMLYIPPRWWHYVKALSKSFSVSFWWAADEIESALNHENQ